MTDQWDQQRDDSLDEDEVSGAARLCAHGLPLPEQWGVAAVMASERSRRPPRAGLSSAVEAVLFDRDGTLVVDVPYNGDPARVETMPGAYEAVTRLREMGVKVGVVTNQSGVGRGIITCQQVRDVNRRVAELLGPFQNWQVCPHRPDSGCECRKPAGGMILAAAAALGVSPERCVVVGDIGSDVAAARAAGTGHILVPTPKTRPDEVAQADTVSTDLESAVRKLAPFLRGLT
jgi:D-glycero-D-manno-heptose 1,7-bisphosphate phosphatase